jgi:UDP-N-acetylmuramyl pentapeptide phosphotransferase/UDP-N-acetylglucosamine-1-phosphate transferase
MPLIAVIVLNENLITLQEFSLLASSMILGYVDDKRELSQRLKLACLIIFFVLFFNQIDGINGLSTLTFITFISLIFFLTNYTIMAVPLFISITVSTLVYLNFNMRLKTVLQGDAGSYFIGAFSYLIISRYENYTEIAYSIFFLAPLLLDVSLTSISRVWYRKKLLEGHRDNIYQQLTVKYKRHSHVTFSIVTLQLVFSIFVILSNKYFIIYNSILFNILLSFMLLFFWYRLHLKFNVKNI